MKIESYKQGNPCWTDLSTTDQDGAKTFYSKLFGWDYQDIPMGEGQVYSIAKLNGSDAGAIFTQVPQEAEAGVPPHWKVYFAVDDINSIASKVSDLGGTVIFDEFDEDESGQMMMAQDPTGAMIQFWQAKENIGCEVRDEHGALTWVELLTSDQEGAGKFYTELLGIDLDKETMPTPEGDPYHMLMVDGVPVAGVMPSPEHLVEMGVPSHWEVYFRVDDADAVVEKAKPMGAQVMFGPEVLPMVGTFAVIQDPQGAVFGIQQAPVV